MGPFQKEVLETIADHDGQYSWYQLDRALVQFSPNSEGNLPGVRGLMRVIRGLLEGGLISESAGQNPSQPVYVLTAEGKQALDESRRGSGAEMSRPGGVRSLVEDALSNLSRPYSEDVIDEVFLEIEASPRLLSGYRSLCENLGVTAVNRAIGKWTSNAAGREGRDEAPARSKLIETYPKLSP